MKLFIKYSVLALIVLISGVLIFLLTLDINQYKPVLVQTVSEMTGRELQIEGDLKLTPSLSPAISAEGITLANAPWSSSGALLLTVGRVEAKVSLLPLLSGAIHINRFILHDTKISLETDAEGTGNWIMGTDTGDTATVVAADDAGQGTTTLPPVSIGEVDIRNARITYIDGIAGTTTQFAINELTTGISDLDTPMTFTLNAGYGAFPIQLGGTLGPIDTLLADTSYSVDIKGQISGFDVSAVGKIEKPLSVEGLDINFSANTGTLSDLNQFAGTELPRISPVTLSGNLKFSDLREIVIEALKMQVGQTDLSGRINYQATDTLPALSIQIQSDLIDMTPFSSKETENQQRPEFLFPREQLPLDTLSLVELDMSVTAKQFKSTAAELTDLQLTVNLEDGDMLVVIGSGMAGGTLAGNINLDVRNNLPPSFNIELSGTGIQLGQLPHDPQKPWFTGGPVDLEIKGTGQGDSVAAIMGGFNGKLLVKVGEATMPNDNVDLFGADILTSVFSKLNPLSASEKSTLLECAVINFDIRDGITKVDRQIAMQTTKMSMVGSGEINFKTEQLSMGIKPYARKGIGLNLGSITGIAKIGGTLANPGAEIDAQGALKAGVTAGAAIATGGLSLLAQGLFSKTTDDPDPCNTALGKAVTVQTQAEPAAETPPEENKGSLLDNVKSGFKSLFGR